MASAFGDKLREFREGQGITQAELAKRAKMTRDGIAHLEQGRRQPTWETVLSLCAALGIECTAFAPKPKKGGSS